ncbi:MAG: hypothetical protein IJR26_09365, partial [Bacteroidales bacterium]|nr:hypothetical protein [Bacteroidales bacterium]
RMSDRNWHTVDMASDFYPYILCKLRRTDALRQRQRHPVGVRELDVLVTFPPCRHWLVGFLGPVANVQFGECCES